MDTCTSKSRKSSYFNLFFTRYILQTVPKAGDPRSLTNATSCFSYANFVIGLARSHLFATSVIYTVCPSTCISSTLILTLTIKSIKTYSNVDGLKLKINQVKAWVQVPRVSQSLVSLGGQNPFLFCIMENSIHLPSAIRFEGDSTDGNSPSSMTAMQQKPALKKI